MGGTRIQSVGVPVILHTEWQSNRSILVGTGNLNLLLKIKLESKPSCYRVPRCIIATSSSSVTDVNDAAVSLMLLIHVISMLDTETILPTTNLLTYVSGVCLNHATSSLVYARLWSMIMGP